MSLFSGIGGAELAAEWAGWKNVLSCDINEFGNRVLKYYWPDAYHHTDIHTLNYDTINTELTRRFGENWRNKPVIITGGFPCQPFSMAGKRKGTEDDRHLWPEMLRIIREVRPDWVVGENVFGFVNWDGGMVFDQVQTDLEAEGYEVIPFILPAVAVNSVHRRDRVWIVAHNNLFGQSGNSKQVRNGENRTFGNGFVQFCHGERRDAVRSVNAGNCKNRDASDPNFGGLERSTTVGRDCEYVERISGVGNVADPEITRSKGKCIKGQGEVQPDRRDCIKVQPGWGQFPTQPPVCNRNDGLSDRLVGITFPKWRNESIKAMGNSWVPQVAYQIFKAINQYELHDPTRC